MTFARNTGFCEDKVETARIRAIDMLVHLLDQDFLGLLSAHDVPRDLCKRYASSSPETSDPQPMRRPSCAPTPTGCCDMRAPNLTQGEGAFPAAQENGSMR